MMKCGDGPLSLASSASLQDEQLFVMLELIVHLPGPQHENERMEAMPVHFSSSWIWWDQFSLISSMSPDFSLLNLVSNASMSWLGRRLIMSAGI